MDVLGKIAEPRTPGTTSSEDDLTWLIQTAKTFLSNIRTGASDEDDTNEVPDFRRDVLSEAESLLVPTMKREPSPLVIVNGLNWRPAAVAEPVLFITPNRVINAQYCQMHDCLVEMSSSTCILHRIRGPEQTKTPKSIHRFYNILPLPYPYFCWLEESPILCLSAPRNRVIRLEWFVNTD